MKLAIKISGCLKLFFVAQEYQDVNSWISFLAKCGGVGSKITLTTLPEGSLASTLLGPVLYFPR